MKKKIYLLTILFMISTNMIGCFWDEDKYEKGNYEVLISIDYESNLILAKDSMNIYIDNHKFYTVNNGDVNSNIYYLTKGKHKIKVKSGMFHHKEIEFEVENTGDYFSFMLKNHTNKVEFGLLNSGNIYMEMGEDIPEVEDFKNYEYDNSDIEKEGDSNSFFKIKENAIVKIILLVVKSIFIFIGLCILCYLFGSIIFSLFHTSVVGTVLCCISIFTMTVMRDMNTQLTFISLCFLVIALLSHSQIKKIPKEYVKFSVVKSGVSGVYSVFYGVTICAFLMYMPEVVAYLPFKISYLDWMIYIYLLIAIISSMTISGSIAGFPEKVKNFVEFEGSVDMEKIIEFAKSNKVDEVDNEDTINREVEKIKITLVELAKMDLIEKDDSTLCFRRKSVPK